MEIIEDDIKEEVDDLEKVKEKVDQTEKIRREVQRDIYIN